MSWENGTRTRNLLISGLYKTRTCYSIRSERTSINASQCFDNPSHLYGCVHYTVRCITILLFPNFATAAPLGSYWTIQLTHLMAVADFFLYFGYPQCQCTLYCKLLKLSNLVAGDGVEPPTSGLVFATVETVRKR